MKNSSNAGFDQHYNAQVAVDQASLLIVANTLSNHPTDQAEAIPTLEAIPPEVGKPAAGALDCGFFNSTTIEQMQAYGIQPFIATGREPHHRSWRSLCAECAECAELPAPPPAEASWRVKMAHTLQTAVGQAIYRLRKCTVESVIGIIKEVIQFRQFSLRGLMAAATEWSLVCTAFNLKRLHTLLQGCLV